MRNKSFLLSGFIFKINLFEILFKKYSAPILSIQLKEFLQTFIQHQNQEKEHLHHPEKLLCVAQETVVLPLLSPLSHTTTDLLPITVLQFLKFHINKLKLSHYSLLLAMYELGCSMSLLILGILSLSNYNHSSGCAVVPQ